MQRKTKLLILFLIIVLLIFIIVPPTKKAVRGLLFSIIESPASFLSEKGRNAKSFFSFYIHIGELKKQNAILSSSIQNLEVDKSRIAELEHENAILKRELGYLEKNPDSKLLASKIIGREPTSFLDYILVDKGSKSGVVTSMAVLSEGILIGQVSEVYDNQSKVTLVTSKDSIILAMLQGSRSKGILKGGISGLILENITQDVVYEPGENIVTSGLDGSLKPGILIGKAGRIQTSSSDLYKNISVEPIADLSKLEMVFIEIQ